MPASDKVSTSVLTTRTLTSSMWDEIWTLTAEFYDVERAYAEAELRKRQSVALIRMNDALLGMASIDIYPARFRGRGIAVISTTHVLLRENWRGRNLLQRLGFRTFLATRLRYPFRPIYWFSRPSVTRVTCCCRAISPSTGHGTNSRPPRPRQR